MSRPITPVGLIGSRKSCAARLCETCRVFLWPGRTSKGSSHVSMEPGPDSLTKRRGNGQGSSSAATAGQQGSASKFQVLETFRFLAAIQVGLGEGRAGGQAHDTLGGQIIHQALPKHQVKDLPCVAYRARMCVAHGQFLCSLSCGE